MFLVSWVNRNLDLPSRLCFSWKVNLCSVQP